MGDLVLPLVSCVEAWTGKKYRPPILPLTTCGSGEPGAGVVEQKSWLHASPRTWHTVEMILDTGAVGEHKSEGQSMGDPALPLVC